VLVNLFRDAADDLFVQHPELNAADGLHPSDAGYRAWFVELMTQAALQQRLSAALAEDRSTLVTLHPGTTNDRNSHRASARAVDA
jgi:hypothetical protein